MKPGLKRLLLLALLLPVLLALMRTGAAAPVGVSPVSSEEEALVAGGAQTPTQKCIYYTYKVYDCGTVKCDSDNPDIIFQCGKYSSWETYDGKTKDVYGIVKAKVTRHCSACVGGGTGVKCSNAPVVYLTGKLCATPIPIGDIAAP